MTEDKFQLGEMTAEVKNLKAEVGFMREDIQKLYDLIACERVNTARMSTKIATLTGTIGIIAGSVSAWFANYLLNR